jgi:hypothetical protein
MAAIRDARENVTNVSYISDDRDPVERVFRSFMKLDEDDRGDSTRPAGHSAIAGSAPISLTLGCRTT